MIEKPATVTGNNGVVGGNGATVTAAVTPAKSPFCSSCAVSTVATSTHGSVSATPTGPVQFTGAAGKTTPGSFMAIFAVVGAGAMGAVALVL